MEARMHRTTALVVSIVTSGFVIGCAFNGERTGLNGAGGGGGTGNQGRGGNAGTGVTVDSSVTPTVDSNCGQVEPPTTMLPPDLLIVQDKSGSMNNDSNDMNTCGGMAGCSKWDQMTPAIEQVVMQTQTTVRWGLKFFANNNSCGVNPGAAVAVGLNSSTAINTAIGGTRPGGSTPTRLAMNSAVTYLQGLTDPNPKFILLATDGIPNCIPGNNNAGTVDGPGAVQAIADAKTAGFPTFVVGIGNTGAAQTLTDMATAGGEALPTAPGYYQVSSGADLVAALSMISSGIVSCTISVGTMPPPNPTNVLVQGDGVTIPQDATNGWSYVSGMLAIQLNGTSCDNLKNMVTKKIRVIFGCGNVPIIP
jgi:hypothetical protein